MRKKDGGNDLLPSLCLLINRRIMDLLELVSLPASALPKE